MPDFLPRIPRALAVACLGSLLAAGCRREPVAAFPAAEPPVASVRVEPVAPRGPVPSETVMGTVHARHRASVESRVVARIESLAVTTGTRVSAGDVVALLDARDLRARREKASAQRDRAVADLVRLERLSGEGAAPPSELDAARERRAVADAAVAEAETALGHARVVAPFAGVVTRKWLDAGDQAAPGRAIVDIEQLTELRLEINVPESLVARLAVGTRVAVRLGTTEDSFDAVVGEVDPVADPATRTHLVKLDLPSSPSIRPGAFGVASIPLGESKSPHVPASALVRRGQMEMVFVVADGRAGLRWVRVGRASGGMVELSSGVTPGESVVTDGSALLVDGQRVEVRR